MTHDPLCLVSRPVRRSCECDFIAEVRADERSKLVEVMGQVFHQNADRGNRVIVFAGKPVDGGVLVWRDGQYVWENPR